MNWDSKFLLMFAFASLAYAAGESVFEQDPRAVLGVVGLATAVCGSFYRFRLPSCQPKPSRIGNMLVVAFGLALAAASYHWTLAAAVIVVLAHPVSTWFAQFEMRRSQRSWHRLVMLGLALASAALVAPAYGYVQNPLVLLVVNVLFPVAIAVGVTWRWQADVSRQPKLPLGE